jgi:hypothetical protein
MSGTGTLRWRRPLRRTLAGRATRSPESAATSPSSPTAGRASAPSGGRRIWTWLAWTLAAVVMGLVVIAIVFRVLAGADLFLVVVENAVTVPVSAAVGAMIVGRRVRNAVGWMLLVSALGWASQASATAAVLHLHAVGETGSTTYHWLAWIGAYGWVLSFATIILLLPLLFPDGRLPSRRWRPVLWLALAMYGLGVVQALAPGPLVVEEGVLEVAVNPAGVDALVAVLPYLDVAATVVFLPALAGCVTAPIVRFRRSRGVERQQIKWLVPPILLLPIVLPLTGFAATETLGLVLGAVATTSIPVAIGVAVLRYRLYDIDRVISRTLAYAALTVFLVGVYAASVLGLGWLVRSVAAGGGDLVVAASTLGVAALFGPARRRIQAFVDRRFNRARYDARQVVEEFTQWLRDEVDLATVREALEATAGSAEQPRSVGVWLPPEREVAR